MRTDRNVTGGARSDRDLDAVTAVRIAGEEGEDLRDVAVAFAWFFSFPLVGIAAPSLPASSLALSASGIIGIVWIVSALWAPRWGPVTSAIPLLGVAFFLVSLFVGNLLVGYDQPTIPGAGLAQGAVIALVVLAAAGGALSTVTVGRVRGAATLAHLASGVGLLFVVGWSLLAS